jgi:hypothetical protein
MLFSALLSGAIIFPVADPGFLVISDIAFLLLNFVFEQVSRLSTSEIRVEARQEPKAL